MNAKDQPAVDQSAFDETAEEDLRCGVAVRHLLHDRKAWPD